MTGVPKTKRCQGCKRRKIKVGSSLQVYTIDREPEPSLIMTHSATRIGQHAEGVLVPKSPARALQTPTSLSLRATMVLLTRLREEARMQQ